MADVVFYLSVMAENIIRLCYRKIIDSNAQKQWDKNVWEDTCREFAMQSQMYNINKKFTSYAELLSNVQGADKIPFLVSTAAIGYLKQLNGIVPDITNALGHLFLPFKNYKFELIQSDVTNIGTHKIAISFISEPVTWLDTVNGTLLISLKGERDVNDDALLTEMMMLQPFLSIFSIKKETE